jgi:hypothetical protein
MAALRLEHPTENLTAYLSRTAAANDDPTLIDAVAA